MHDCADSVWSVGVGGRSGPLAPAGAGAVVGGGRRTGTVAGSFLDVAARLSAVLAARLFDIAFLSVRPMPSLVG